MLAGLIWPVAAAWSAQPTETGVFKDWRAYSFADAGGKICYIVSVPQKQEGKYKRRGDVFFLVTHRPEGQVFDEVSIITGYTYKKGSEPKAKIGGSQFAFYSEGDAAWAFRKDESKLIGAMKKGRRMIITGVSSRGTLTTDTYSLSGVTAGLRHIDKECGRK